MARALASGTAVLFHRVFVTETKQKHKCEPAGKLHQDQLLAQRTFSTTEGFGFNHTQTAQVAACSLGAPAPTGETSFECCRHLFDQVTPKCRGHLLCNMACGWCYVHFTANEKRVADAIELLCCFDTLGCLTCFLCYNLALLRLTKLHRVVTTYERYHPPVYLSTTTKPLETIGLYSVDVPNCFLPRETRGKRLDYTPLTCQTTSYHALAWRLLATTKSVQAIGPYSVVVPNYCVPCTRLAPVGYQ